MDKDILNLVREWIRAEIDARIADAQPGSDGYYGTGYAENKAADAMFEKVCELLTPNAKVSGAGTASAGLPGYAFLRRE